MKKVSCLGENQNEDQERLDTLRYNSFKALLN